MRTRVAFGGAIAGAVGRLVLVALIVMTAVAGVEALSDPGMNLLALAFAVLLLGVLLMTFKSTETAGLVLAATGGWSVLTGYAAVALLDPFSVVTDTDGSTRVEVETAGGAYVLGGFFFLVANVPVALWAVARVRGRQHARRHRELVESPAHHAAGREHAAREEERREQRARAKRRRKKRRR